MPRPRKVTRIWDPLAHPVPLQAGTRRRLERLATARAVLTCLCLFGGLLALLGVAYVMLWLAPSVTKHVDSTLDGTDRTLEMVNRPCDAKDARGLKLKDGVFCNLDTLVTRVGDLSVSTQLQVKQSGKLIDAAAGTLTQAGAAIQNSSTTLNATLAHHVDPLLDEVAGDAKAAQPGLVNLATVLDRAAPLEDAATADLKSFDAVLNSKDLAQAFANTNAVTGHLAGITGDFETRFHQILYPPPCVTKSCKFAKVFWPAVKEAPYLGESLYWIKESFGQVPTPVQVTVKEQKKEPATPRR